MSAMRLCMLVAMLAFVAGGCGKKKKQTKSDPKPATPAMTVRLWTDAELATLEASLMKRLDDNVTRTCVRPVLHGTKQQGPAGPAIVALAEPAGELDSCLRDIAKAEQGVRLSDLIEQRAPHIVAFDQKCGPAFETALGSIAQHEDACSPYRTGARVDPMVGLMPILRTAQMLSLRGRLRAQSGDVPGGLWLELDTARAMQDLARSGTSLVIAMIANAAEKSALDGAHDILSTAAVKGRPVQDIDKALVALLASEVSFHEVANAELDYMALHMGLARSKPASWKPPGGRSELTRSDEVITDDKLSPRDDAALILATAEKLRPIVDTACPATAAWQSCVKELDATKARLSSSTSPLGDPQEMALQLVKKLGDKPTPEVLEKSRHEIQAAITDVLVGLSMQIYPSYARKRAYTVARLAAARVHLEAQRMGHCPTQAELASPRFAAFVKPAILGDTLVVERSEDAPPAARADVGDRSQEPGPGRSNALRLTD
jgi:hypothetical protein